MGHLTANELREALDRYEDRIFGSLTAALLAMRDGGAYLPPGAPPSYVEGWKDALDLALRLVDRGDSFPYPHNNQPPQSVTTDEQ